ncbi:MAG: glycosyltransferase family 1 protein [Candidatus Daviesbacteria bacterium]|nr:glycosyltransferase family 1 protein [Candidatus Daviesbacteria bacterium]
MIKVAISKYPLISAHKKRGIGYYTQNLIDQLKKDKSISIQEFVNQSEVKDTDVIHYPWFDLYSHTLPIKNKFPTVVTIHDVIPLIFRKNYPVGIKGKFNFFLQKISLNNCRAIITDSEASKKDIKKYLKIEDEKIFIVYLAVDESFKKINESQLIRLRRKYHLPQRFILYSGDANWTKNLPFLVKGFKNLVNIKGYDDIKLVLISDVFLKKLDNIDHPELNSLKDTLKFIETNLEGKVITPGFVEKDELVAFYNLATVYVQPSLYEGFGLPILQALACGTPTVSSSAGSLPEVGGKTALYFDPNNLEQFSSLLKETINDESLRSRLTILGLEQAKKFSWEKVAAETKNVYLKALRK